MSITASDPEKGKHDSNPRDEAIERLFMQLFRTPVPKGIEPVIQRKLGESSSDIRAAAGRISSSSSDSEEAFDVNQVRELIMQAIHEAFEEKNLESADALMQLKLKEQEVRQERYKFLAGVAGTVTGLLAFGGTIVAYQASGC